MDSTTLNPGPASELIVIRNQVSHVVVAGFVGDRFRFGVLLKRGYCELGANHRSTGLISDCAEDASVYGLSLCEWRHNDAPAKAHPSYGCPDD
jgi:hypothetical protein